MAIAASDEDVMIVVFTAILARNNPVCVKKIVVIFRTKITLLRTQLLDLLS